MSAEVENNKEEETKEQQIKSLRQKFYENWQIGLKIIELLVCAVCMGCIFEPARVLGLGSNHLHHAGIMYTAYTGFMLINVLLLSSRVIGDKISYKTSILFSLNGAALFFITAVLLLVDRSELVKSYSFHPNAYRVTMLTTSVCFAFANALLFFIDAFFTHRRKQDS